LEHSISVFMARTATGDLTSMHQWHHDASFWTS